MVRSQNYCEAMLACLKFLPIFDWYIVHVFFVFFSGLIGKEQQDNVKLFFVAMKHIHCNFRGVVEEEYAFTAVICNIRSRYASARAPGNIAFITINSTF